MPDVKSTAATVAGSLSTAAPRGGSVTHAHARVTRTRGIDCGTTCSYLYGALKFPLVLTPTASVDSAFAGWGGACTGTPASQPCKLTLDASALSEIAVTAKFDLLDQPGGTTGGGTTGGGTSGGATGGGTTAGGTTAGGTTDTKDTTLDAQLVAVKVAKSKLGRRIVRIELSADEAVSVRAAVARNGKQLAGRTIRQFKEGRRVVEVLIGNGTHRGAAKLTLTLSDQAGNERTIMRTIRIPKR